jgi:WD40 repeat protein
VWDTGTGRLLRRLGIRGTQVADLSFSPEGHHIVIAHNDQTARVWDIVTGQPVTPPLKHEGAINRARFSPDGEMVVTASEDRTVRVWDAATGEPITPPLSHGGRVHDATFSPDSRRLVTASLDDGTATVWELPSDERQVEDLLDLAHLLSTHRIDDTTGLVFSEPTGVRRAFESLRRKYPGDFSQREPRRVAPP